MHSPPNPSPTHTSCSLSPEILLLDSTTPNNRQPIQRGGPRRNDPLTNLTSFPIYSLRLTAFNPPFLSSQNLLLLETMLTVASTYDSFTSPFEGSSKAVAGPPIPSSSPVEFFVGLGDMLKQVAELATRSASLMLASSDIELAAPIECPPAVQLVRFREAPLLARGGARVPVCTAA